MTSQRLSSALKPGKEIFVLLCSLFLICGCTSIPKEALSSYVTSVGEAKQAGQTLLADWRSARAESDRRTFVKAPPATTIPIQRPPAVSGPGAPKSSEDTRILAWEAIGEYTTILAQLNAGESVNDVKQTAGRLFELATTISGSAFPGGDALVSLLQGLAAEIEKARLAAEFKKAIVAGAPVVRRIIDEVMVRDLADLYQLRSTLANEDHAAVVLETNLSASDKTIKQSRIADEFKAFAASLDAYEALLRQTSSSLRHLETAVKQPIDFSAEANRIFSIASDLKRQWDAYQYARREGRK